MAEMLKIQVLHAGKNGSYALDYRYAGSPRVHHNEGDGRGNGSISSYQVGQAEHAFETAILSELLSDPEAVHPKGCEMCAPHEQAYLWRSFTERSWNTFVQNGCRGPSPDTSDGELLDEGGIMVSKAKLHKPGVLWTAKDIRMALSVGLARKMCEREEVRLMGIPLCQHTLDAGMHMWNVLQVNRELRKLSPVTMDELLNGNFYFSDGVIVDQIPEETLRRCLLYSVETSFLGGIADMVGVVDREQTEMTRYLYVISTLLDEILVYASDMSGQNGDQEEPWCLNRITPPLRSLVGRPQRVI